MKHGGRTYYRVIFTFGVMLFLLRPFVVYLTIGTHGIAGDFLRTSQLTQRLIKKKEQYHEAEAEAVQEPSRSRYASRYADPLPARLTRCMFSLFYSLYSRIRSVAVSLFTSSIFEIVPDNHWYRSHSLFRI